jgi:hypothetical protein
VVLVQAAIILETALLAEPPVLDLMFQPRADSALTIMDHT